MYMTVGMHAIYMHCRYPFIQLVNQEVKQACRISVVILMSLLLIIVMSCAAEINRTRTNCIVNICSKLLYSKTVQEPSGIQHLDCKFFLW